MNLTELQSLLAILKEAGVTRYESADLKLEIASGAPKWTDFRAELAKVRDAEAEDEEQIQFAHVAGGPPPKFSQQ